MRRTLFTAALAAFAAPAFAAENPAPATPPTPRFGSAEMWNWKTCDTTRPMPPRAEPKPEAELAASAKAPAGATVLFDGTDLSRWKPSKWKVENGYVEVTPKAGNLVTGDAFGSCKLHLEWWTPATAPLKSGQNRGNSGVFLMGRYEMQVLDSVDNATYADGIAGSVYGQYPPLFNACRAPGNWQYYDIEFHRPVFADGKVVKPARITARLNGVLVQDNVELSGPTDWKVRKPYSAHPDKLPLELQDHKETVRYRNVWITPLAD